MKSKQKVNIIINILLSIGLVISIVLIIFKLTFVRVVVNGISMNPSIIDGSIGFMVKVNENSKIKRFDVVVSEYLNKGNYLIIKRVLGLPNEEIDLIDNKLYVNGQEVKQEFDFIPKDDNFEITHFVLKDHEYLLVGDNRNNTVPPVIENISAIIAKNGFSVAKYDITSEKCGVNNYSSCPIKEVSFYNFR